MPRSVRTGRPWRRFRRQVLETYGPICCFGEACRMGDPLIDLALEYPHPGYFTVHHLDPLALGGALLNLDRARPAHLRCNTAQGARPMVLSRRTSAKW